MCAIETVRPVKVNLPLFYAMKAFRRNGGKAPSIPTHSTG